MSAGRSPAIGLHVVGESVLFGAIPPVAVKLLRLIFSIFAGLALAGGLRAQFVLTTLTNTSTFTGSETILGFNTLANLESITTQFAAQGVTFPAGALMASTNSGDTNLFPSNADGVIATNWDGSPALTWTITFSTPQTQVGFLVEMNTGDQIQLAPSLGAVAHGSVTRTSAGVTPVFFGVGDAATFDKLTFTVSGTNNHFFGMDNFRFTAVPEPSAVWLLGAGLTMAGLAARRRAKRQ